MEKHHRQGGLDRSTVVLQEQVCGKSFPARTGQWTYGHTFHFVCNSVLLLVLLYFTLYSSMFPLFPPFICCHTIDCEQCNVDNSLRYPYFTLQVVLVTYVVPTVSVFSILFNVRPSLFERFVAEKPRPQQKLTEFC